MDWRIFPKVLGVSRIVAAVMEIRATGSISELFGMQILHGTQEEINEVIWGRGCHATV